MTTARDRPPPPRFEDGPGGFALVITVRAGILVSEFETSSPMETDWTIDTSRLVNRHQAKALGRKYKAEVASCLANLGLVLAELGNGTPISAIPYPFFRSEGNGVFRIGQTGVSAAREMRLYVTFVFIGRTAFILAIGTKNTQSRDIADARRAAKYLERDTP